MQAVAWLLVVESVPQRRFLTPGAVQSADFPSVPGHCIVESLHRIELVGNNSGALLAAELRAGARQGSCYLARPWEAGPKQGPGERQDCVAQVVVEGRMDSEQRVGEADG
jgi:hypothetical protein